MPQGCATRLGDRSGKAVCVCSAGRGNGAGDFNRTAARLPQSEYARFIGELPVDGERILDEVQIDSPDLLACRRWVESNWVAVVFTVVDRRSILFMGRQPPASVQAQTDEGHWAVGSVFALIQRSSLRDSRNFSRTSLGRLFAGCFAAGNGSSHLI